MRPQVYYGGQQQPPRVIDIFTLATLPFTNSNSVHSSHINNCYILIIYIYIYLYIYIYINIEYKEENICRMQASGGDSRSGYNGICKTRRKIH